MPDNLAMGWLLSARYELTPARHQRGAAVPSRFASYPLHLLGLVQLA